MTGPATNLAARLPRVPVTCFWEITDACNLRCIHCEADGGRRGTDELSTDEALALAGQLAAAGCQRVNLTGGEPLLRPDWPLLARRLAALGLQVVVISNGLPLAGEAAVERLVQAGVSGVSISLDGEREVHDAIRQPAGDAARAGSRHQAAVRAIELLAASPLTTAVITQVHRRNLDSLARMYEQLAQLGVQAWQVQIAMPLGRLLALRREYMLAPRQLAGLQARLAALIEDGRVPISVADNIGYYGPHEATLRGAAPGAATFWTGCLAGVRLVALRANGDVKGCPSQPTAFVVGNVRRASFAEIWADPRLHAYNTAWDEDLLQGGCARCELRRICRAGCTTMAYAVTGSIHCNPFCVRYPDAVGHG